MRALEELVDEAHPIFATEAKISEHKIDLLAIQHGPRFPERRRYVHVKRVFQRRSQTLACVLFVIDDEDRGLHLGEKGRDP
jgi:hypothetical protein